MVQITGAVVAVGEVVALGVYEMRAGSVDEKEIWNFASDFEMTGVENANVIAIETETATETGAVIHTARDAPQSAELAHHHGISFATESAMCHLDPTLIDLAAIHEMAPYLEDHPYPSRLSGYHLNVAEPSLAAGAAEVEEGIGCLTEVAGDHILKTATIVTREVVLKRDERRDGGGNEMIETEGTGIRSPTHALETPVTSVIEPRICFAPRWTLVGLAPRNSPPSKRMFRRRLLRHLPLLSGLCPIVLKAWEMASQVLRVQVNLHQLHPGLLGSVQDSFRNLKSRLQGL